VTGEWRRLHTEDLQDLCSSPGIIRANKFGRIKWTGRVKLVGEKKNLTSLVGKSVEGDHMEHLGVKWACNSKEDLKEVGLDEVN
jgi:hypothetical protein